MEVGDLVKVTKHAHAQLEWAPTGLGCITRADPMPNVSGHPIVYVTWYKNGVTRPINALWIEKV